jgi:uncharacterized membrane protein
MIPEFLQRYFIDPIYQGTGYNPYNTVVYGLLLGLGILLLFRLFQRLHLSLDAGFLGSLLPFLVLGSVLRVLEDAALLPRSALFITPGIFLLIALIYLGGLFLSLALQRRRSIPYPLPLAALGFALLLAPAYRLLQNLQGLNPLFYVGSATGASLLLSLSLGRLVGRDLDPRSWIFWILGAHFLDLYSTVFAVERYGYFAEHYLEGKLVAAAGTAWVLLPLKLLVLGTVLAFLRWALREEEEERNFWYLALFILGFSPGLRDLLSMLVLGV